MNIKSIPTIIGAAIGIDAVVIMICLIVWGIIRQQKKRARHRRLNMFVADLEGRANPDLQVITVPEETLSHQMVGLPPHTR